MATTVEFFRDYGVDFRTNGQRRWPDECSAFFNAYPFSFGLVISYLYPHCHAVLFIKQTLSSSIMNRKTNYEMIKTVTHRHKFTRPCL